MAVYKVIQDIEAEDKLLGPLTLKQFIYAAIVAFLGFLEFRMVTSVGLGPLRWLFFFIFLLPMVLFAVLASPLGRDQPTEIWLLSHIRFFLKPHLRVWNQTGQKDLVTITAPKQTEAPVVKDLSQPEVKSRLKLLANTLDTRGWAFKNVAVNPAAAETSDRLVSAGSVPQAVPAIDVRPEDDILDVANNSTAQKFSNLMQAKTAEQKAQRATTMQTAQAGGAAEPIVHFAPPAAATAAPAKPYVPARPAPPPPTPTPKQTAKLNELAKSDELKVSSISQLANHQAEPPVNEVVVSLH